MSRPHVAGMVFGKGKGVKPRLAAHTIRHLMLLQAVKAGVAQ